MDYQNHYPFHRSTSTSGDRSVSVSSTASSASHHSPFRSESRALSPASVISEPASSILARSHQQLQVSSSHQSYPSYATHTPPPSMLLPGSSQYHQPQIGSQMSLYSSIPPPRVFGQQFPSSFNFQLNNVPSQPSPLSYQNYPPPPSLYPSYATPSPYHDPSPAPISSYHPPHQVHLHDQHLSTSHEIETGEFLLGRLPPEVVAVIRRHVGYLESRKLLRLSSWFKENFDVRHFSEEELVAGVHEAEQCFKRYHINSRNNSNSNNSRRDSANSQRIVMSSLSAAPAPSDSFACYHCYKMKSPENFELFAWHSQASREERENEGGVGSGGDEAESNHSTTPATGAASSSSVPTTPTPRKSSLPSSNPYYDPTITRTSILEAQVAARNNRNNRDNRSNSPATATTPTPGSTTGGGHALGGGDTSGPAGLSSDMGRVKSTWGIRRFCIDCGMRKKYYKPTDLIQVHGERGVVNWVCACFRVRVRSVAPSCLECGLHSRYEPPGGRRRGV